MMALGRSRSSRRYPMNTFSSLADKMGLVVPPELERSFLMEALLEAFEEDSKTENPRGFPLHAEETRFSGPRVGGEF
jgi:hypothetical protein